MSKQSWFTIARNAAKPTSAEISIHAEIGYWGISARNFMEQLKLLDDVEEIQLSLHSPGGEVLDGWAIYNALKFHPARVVTTVKGLAASMASVIMLASDEIRIPKNAQIMIHRVSGGGWGTADEVRQSAELIQKLEDGIVTAYAERTGLDEKEIREMMDKETWMDGTEAVAKGFADKLLAKVAAQNCAADWASRFSTPPAALFDTPPKSSASDNPSPTDEMKPDEIKALIAAEIKTALAAELKTALTAHATEHPAPTMEAIKKEITDSITPAIENALKPVADLTTRLTAAENAIKSGVAGAAGGTAPLNNGGQGEGEGEKPAAPTNRAELEAAMKGKPLQDRVNMLNEFNRNQKR